MAALVANLPANSSERRMSSYGQMLQRQARKELDCVRLGKPDDFASSKPASSKAVIIKKVVGNAQTCPHHCRKCAHTELGLEIDRISLTLLEHFTSPMSHAESARLDRESLQQLEQGTARRHERSIELDNTSLELLQRYTKELTKETDLDQNDWIIVSWCHGSVNFSPSTIEAYRDTVKADLSARLREISSTTYAEEIRLAAHGQVSRWDAHADLDLDSASTVSSGDDWFTVYYDAMEVF